MASAPIIAKLRERLVASATARQRKGKLPTGVRWWLKYCLYGRGISPL